MNDTYKIVSRMNGKVITISKGQKFSKPGELIMETYIGSPYQHFRVVASKQYNEIRSVAFPNKLLDVTGESKKVYEHLIAYDYNGNLNQKWIIHNIDNSFCKIESPHSKMVMEVEGGVDAEGVGVVQNTDYNNLSQMWKF